MAEVTFSVGSRSQGAVIFGVQAGSVMRVNIDDTLSVSGEAADAYATGQAIAEKLDAADLRSQLNVNGRTVSGASGWSITVNGDNIPAGNDSDAESVAEALERLAGADGTAAQALADEILSRSAADDALQAGITAEAEARAAVDTALDARVTALEGKTGLVVDLLNVTYTGQLPVVSDSRITADHQLIGWQFYTGATIADADATRDELFDLDVVTAAGSFTATVPEGTLRQSGGSVRLFLMYGTGVI